MPRCRCSPVEGGASSNHDNRRIYVERFSVSSERGKAAILTVRQGA